MDQQPNLSPGQIDLFNTLFSSAIERMKLLVRLGENNPKSINFFDKIKINKSIKELKKCLEIHPGHWQSLVFLAKAYQRLNEHTQALELLEKAFKIEKNASFISQEAAIECIHLNDIKKALFYSEDAIQRKPDDYVLLGNHAMYLLIAGRDEEAIKMIQSALYILPSDQFNQKIEKLINDVIAGTRKRPTCIDAKM